MVTINAKFIEVQIGKITKDTPRFYREYLYKVLKDAEKLVELDQEFNGTLLVDNSPRKSPSKVNLNGQLRLIDQIDISDIYSTAEALYYQVAPVSTGEYRRGVRWYLNGSLRNLPLTGNPDWAILTNIVPYTRRMEFGKKETNVLQFRIRKRRGRLVVKKKIKKRWAADAPEGVLLKVYDLLLKKYKAEIRTGKVYIRYRKFSEIPGVLDTYPGIIISKTKLYRTKK